MNHCRSNGYGHFAPFCIHFAPIVVLKQFDTEGSIFGTIFHRKSRIQILCNNLRIKSNIGPMKTATADFVGSIFLGSAFYSFTPFLI